MLSKVYKIIYLFVFILPIVFSQQSPRSSFNCTQPPKLSADFDVSSCCRKPNLNLDSAREKCEAYITAKWQRPNRTGTEEYPAYVHMCYPECIYRETGALVNEEIVLSGVQKFLESNMDRDDHGDVVPHIVKSFETCVENIKTHLKSMGLEKYALLPDGCSPYASLIFTCVNVETFLHCPAKLWKDEENCNVSKSFVEQCNPLPHVPLPLQ